MLFSDWDHSGRRDLRVSNDRHYYRTGQEQLWRIVPGEPPTEYTEADGWRPLQIWGMGIASQDVTGDGLPEVFLTSQADNKLQTLTSDGTSDGASEARRKPSPDYHDIALELGVTAQRPYTGGDVLPVDGVASRVRRREQRRHQRPARDEGERRGAGRPGEP